MNIDRKENARVYSPEWNGKITSATLSTYEGKDQDDNAKWSRWFVRFVGKKAKKASKLEDGSRIVLTNAKIENVYDKKEKKAWYTITVFDWELYQDEEDEE